MNVMPILDKELILFNFKPAVILMLEDVSDK